jgi:hypothetical protein
MIRKLLPFIVALGLLGCSNKENIPAATGVAGSIYVIMDSVQWRGQLGRTLDSIFSADMPGLPRTEPIFKFRWIDPAKLNYVLKQSRNMIFVLTLDQNTSGSRIVQRLFTKESVDKVRSNPAQFMTVTRNLFAKGQEIMYLYGTDEQTLLRNLRANAGKLVDHFNQKEKDRVSTGLFKAGQVTGVGEMLRKEYKCDIKIPFGYKLAMKEPDFVWLRQINPRDDKDIFIARKSYSAQGDFKRENLIKFRNEVCMKYLFEDPDKADTYLLTETNVPFAPVIADTITFNGKFAIRVRGLWRTNTLQMGGPFEAIAVVDEGTNNFYYVEGFTFSPGKDQREIMRELETIILTFKTSDQLPKN